MKLWHLAATGALFMIGMEFSGIVTSLIGNLGAKK